MFSVPTIKSYKTRELQSFQIFLVNYYAAPPLFFFPFFLIFIFSFCIKENKTLLLPTQIVNKQRKHPSKQTSVAAVGATLIQTITNQFLHHLERLILI